MRLTTDSWQGDGDENMETEEEAQELSSLGAEQNDTVQSAIIDLTMTDQHTIDMNRLLNLLKENEQAENCIEGKDTIVLLGDTGVGKTTTLLYLAGAQFVETEDDFTDHYKPCVTTDDGFSKFKTGAGGKSVTQVIQALETTMGAERKLVVCDTPGFGDSRGVEMQISNSMGLIHALQSAKTVIPVVVLSYQAVLDNRGQNLANTLDNVLRMIGMTPDQDDVDFGAFRYILTRCESDKAIRRLNGRLKVLRQDTSDRRPVFLKFFDDLIGKTAPRPISIDPMDNDSRDEIWEKLFSDAETIAIRDPKSFFRMSPPQSVMDKLNVHLGTVIYDIQEGVGAIESVQSKERNCRMQDAVETLVSIHRYLPSSTQGYCEKAMNILEGSVSRRIGAIKNMRWDKETDFVNEVKYFDIEIHNLSRLCNMISGSNVELSNKYLETLAEVLSDGLQSVDIPKWCDSIGFLKKQEMFQWSLFRLKTASGILGKQDKGSIFQKSFDMALERFNSVVASLLAEVVTHGMLQTVSGLEGCEPHVEFGYNMWTFLDSKAIATESELFFMKNLNEIEAQVMQLLQDATARISSAISSLCKDDSNAIDHIMLKALIGLDWQALENARNYVIACGKATRLRSCFRLDTLLKEACSKKKYLDSLLPDLLVRTSKHEKELLDSQQEHSSGDSESEPSIYDILKQTMDRVNGGVGICTRCQSWEDLEQEKIDLSKRVFCEVENDLVRIREHVSAEASELVKNMREATKSAESFLCRLREKDANYGMLLMEMAESRKWTNWSSCLIKKSNSEVMSIVLAAKSWLGWKSKLDQHLQKVLDSIVECFCHQLRMSTTRLSHVRNPLSLLHENSMDCMLILEFLCFRPDQSDFVERTLRGSWTKDLLNRAILQSVKHLVTMLQQLMVVPHNLLQELSFDKFGNLLEMWKNADHVWSSLRSTVRTPEPSCLHNVLSQEWSELQELGGCNKVTSSSTLQSMMTYKARAVIEFVVNVDLMKQEELGLRNKDEVNQLYANISAHVAATRSLKVMISHLENDVQILVEGAYGCALNGIAEQIKMLSNKLEASIERFPEDESCNIDIHLLVTHLDAFAYAMSEYEIDLLSSGAHESVIQAKAAFEARVDNVCLRIPSDVSEIVLKLCCLKQASTEILCWRTDINTCIDEWIANAAKEDKGDLFLVALSRALQNVEGKNAVVAKQLLEQHRCFEAVQLSFFKSATEGQGIDYVLKGLDLSEKQSSHIRECFELYERTYEELVSLGLHLCNTSEGGLDAFMQELAIKARGVASERTISFSEHVPLLAGHLFAHWTLKNGNPAMSFANNARDSHYRLQPHAAQVVSVFLMLNVSIMDHEGLLNAMVELKTGEGKSIVLGVTAVILALLGYDVDCICYSSYLSTRDERAFKTMFVDFGVYDRIWYGMIDGLIWKMVDGLDKLIGDFLVDVTGERHGRKHTSGRHRLLLIDEVDVLFNDNFFGSSHGPGMTLDPDGKMSAFLLYVWKNCLEQNEVDLMKSKEACDVLDVVSNKNRKLFENELKHAIRMAVRVKKKDKTLWEYSIKDGRICEKFMDGVRYYCGYEQMFLAIHEFEQGNLTAHQMKKRLGVSIRISNISYAELPFEYNVILGVTGTLRELSEAHRMHLQEQYDIKTYYYIPSVFGDSRRSFDSQSLRDFRSNQDKDSFFLDLKDEILRRRGGRGSGSTCRPVLVFFDTKRSLLDFYKSPVMQGLKSETRTVTEVESLEERAGLFERATQQGGITLMIREHGRGTDFKVYDEKILKEGGVHVIQAFVSATKSEEVQIQGRCGRQGQLGSYSMIFDVNTVAVEFGLDVNDIIAEKAKGCLYSYLNERRTGIAASCVDRMQSRCRSLEMDHYQSLDFQAAMEEGRDDAKAMSFFYKLNGVPDADVPVVNVLHQMKVKNLKTKKLNEINKRRKHRIETDKAARRGRSDACSHCLVA